MSRKLTKGNLYSVDFFNHLQSKNKRKKTFTLEEITVAIKKAINENN